MCDCTAKTLEVCSQYLSYYKALSLMARHRTDFNMSSSEFMWTIDKAYDLLEEYFRNLAGNFTVDQLQCKWVGYVVS